MDFGIALQWGDMRHMGPSLVITEVAAMANELGYRSLWTTDQITARSENGYSTEPLITAASLLHLVPDMQLGVAVLVLPPRSAVVVAKQAATLSVLSNQRFILGIGAGGHEGESNLLNSEFTSRGRKMDESIEVMCRLWRDDNATFEGDFYDFEHITMNPKPYTGHVPLWIGGSSPAAIRRAGRVGDGWVPALMSPAALADGVTQLRALAKGRQMPVIATMEMVHPGRPKGEEGPMPVHVAGSSEEMIATLQAYEEAGLEHFICSFNATDLDELSRQMRTMSEDVMPHLSE